MLPKKWAELGLQAPYKLPGIPRTNTLRTRCISRIWPMRCLGKALWLQDMNWLSMLDVVQSPVFTKKLCTEDSLIDSLYEDQPTTELWGTILGWFFFDTGFWFNGSNSFAEFKDVLNSFDPHEPSRRFLVLIVSISCFFCYTNPVTCGVDLATRLTSRWAQVLADVEEKIKIEFSVAELR